MNALKKLISEYLNEHQIGRGQFIQLLGYKNVTKGLRQLDKFTEQLFVTADIDKKFFHVLGIDKQAFSDAIKEVQKEINDKERKSFKPSLSIKLSGRPSPLIAGGYFAKLPIPDFPENASLQDEIKLIISAYQCRQLALFAKDRIPDDNCPQLHEASADYFSCFIDELDARQAMTEQPHWAYGNGFIYRRAYEETYTVDRRCETIECNGTKMTVTNFLHGDVTEIWS